MMNIQNYKCVVLFFITTFLVAWHINGFSAEQSLKTSESVDVTLERANQAFDNQQFEKAMNLYDEVIAQQPKNLQVIYWAFLAARAVKDYERGIVYLLKLKKQDGDTLEPRSLLVRAYQKTGAFSKRDNEHQQITQLWKDKGLSDNAYIRDTFMSGEYSVTVFDYFKLRGRIPIKYIFVPQKEEGQYPFYVLLTAEFKGKKDNQVYFIEVWDGDRRYLHDAFEVEPSYDDIKKMASSIIKTGDLNKGSTLLGSVFAVDLKTWLFGGQKTVAQKKKIKKALQRSLHYQYAYGLLPKVFFDDAKRFMALLKEKGKGYLQLLLLKLQESNESGQQTISREEFDFSIIKYVDYTIAIIKLPKPSKMPEAYFVALVIDNNSQLERYFTYEMYAPSSPDSRTDLAIFCEITKKRRLNYGLGGEQINQDSFFELIKDVLDDKIKPRLRENAA